MSEVIIDAFEVINVQQYQREQSGARPSLAQFARKHLIQLEAVIQPGQCIVIGLLRIILRLLHQLGNILADCNVVEQLTIMVVDRADRCFFEKQLTVFAPVDKGIAIGLARQECLP